MILEDDEVNLDDNPNNLYTTLFKKTTDTMYRLVDPFLKQFRIKNIGKEFLMKIVVNVTDLHDNENIDYGKFTNPGETEYSSTTSILVVFEGMDFNDNYKFSVKQKLTPQQMFDLEKISDTGRGIIYNENNDTTIFYIDSIDFAYRQTPYKNKANPSFYNVYILLYEPHPYNTPLHKRNTESIVKSIAKRTNTNVLSHVNNYLPSYIRENIPPRTGGKKSKSKARKNKTRKRNK